MNVDEFVSGLAVKEMALYIAEYLLAAVFKDCQLLISFDLKKQQIERHRIAVVDLNMKPMQRIEAKWLQQDQAIVQHAIQQLMK